jgi:hypothetical protein
MNDQDFIGEKINRREQFNKINNILFLDLYFFIIINYQIIKVADIVFLLARGSSSLCSKFGPFLTS